MLSPITEPGRCYTLLRVDEQGVILQEHHRQRFATAGPTLLAQFDAFCRTASPGVWALAAAPPDFTLMVEPRPPSRLRDDLPVRYVPTPLAPGQGRIPKPPPVGCYAAVRQPGRISLLTSPDGQELYEACVAALVGWDPAQQQLLLPPDDRSRVWSTAEQALREHLPVLHRPLLVHGREPLLLVNAVRATCAPCLPDRPPFPAAVRRRVAELLREEAPG